MSTALLIIDMINNLDFSEGKKLLQYALPVAENIVQVKKMFKDQELPIIYVNDNFGHWKASWEEVYERCSSEDSIGKPLAQMLKPQRDDYFILKPKHSAFYSSNLDVLLNDLQIKKLVITGIAGNICVLFTVNDAYMRGYELHVPENTLASASLELNDFSLRQFKEVFGLETAPLTHPHQI